MPVKKERKSPVTKKVSAVYSLVMTANEQSQKLKGVTILEALKTFVAPDPMKTDVLIVVSKGTGKKKKTIDKEVRVKEARYTFVNPTALELLAKSLSIRLG